MTATHRLTGYDRASERLAFTHSIPLPKTAMARELAGVGSEDIEAIGVYVLENAQAQRLAHELGTQVDTDRFEWCLEPLPQPLEAQSG
jgi:hypothetical protein